MKVLVCIKRVVDYNVKIRVKSDQSGVELANVKMSMNPFDEIAVEEGVRLRESNQADELVVVSIGPSQAQETLRSALALGADRAILVETTETFEPLNIAKILKSIVDQERPDLIVLGKQAIDDDCNQTGQMLAALLGWPQGTFISSLKIENQDQQLIKISREVDGGHEILQMKLPAVLTTDLRLNTPRYPKLPNIMKAKQKPCQIIPIADLALNLKKHSTLLRVQEPPIRKGGIKVNSIEELVDHLHHTARVI